MRSPSRARNSRGYILVTVLVVGLVYFGLMEIILIETVQAHRQAQQFRSRVIAAAAAENAAELAAVDMINSSTNAVEEEDRQSAMEAEYARRPDDSFEITATARTRGIWKTAASVYLEGRIVGTSIQITRAEHTAGE